MDRVEKKSIFDRLEKDRDVEMADSTSSDSIVRLKKTSKSIRDRLSDWEIRKEIDRKSREFSGILKTSPIKQVEYKVSLNFFCLTNIIFQPPKGVVKHRVNQRVILKKVPSKTAMQADSDYSGDERMDSDDFNKQVKFSPEVEVLEIEPRRVPKINVNKISRIKGLRTDGIKDRLGAIKIHRSVDVDSPNTHLHRVKKTLRMKPTKITSPISKSSKMRSDQISVPVKSRLDSFKNNNRRQGSVHNRLSIKQRGGKGNVFDRLGK